MVVRALPQPPSMRFSSPGKAPLHHPARERNCPQGSSYNSGIQPLAGRLPPGVSCAALRRSTGARRREASRREERTDPRLGSRGWSALPGSQGWVEGTLRAGSALLAGSGGGWAKPRDGARPQAGRPSEMDAFGGLLQLRSPIFPRRCSHLRDPALNSCHPGMCFFEHRIRGIDEPLFPLVTLPLPSATAHRN
jgi:hypothetical protein